MSIVNYRKKLFNGKGKKRDIFQILIFKGSLKISQGYLEPGFWAQLHLRSSLFPLFKWDGNLFEKEREEKSVSPWILFWNLQSKLPPQPAPVLAPAGEADLQPDLQRAPPAQQDVPTAQARLSGKGTQTCSKASMGTHCERKRNNAFTSEAALGTQDALRISVNTSHLCNFWIWLTCCSAH